jgi:hypothetical protein
MAGMVLRLQYPHNPDKKSLDAIVRGAHPAKNTKGEATEFCGSAMRNPR